MPCMNLQQFTLMAYVTALALSIQRTVIFSFRYSDLVAVNMCSFLVYSSSSSLSWSDRETLVGFYGSTQGLHTCVSISADVHILCHYLLLSLLAIVLYSHPLRSQF